ncbi:YciI family protein [Virgibacillus sp. 179-BFC.A HS]|uniref:YciI family protein n=1 Tax=Tigheibacillus jepli TaxID=3035914 RepID=A0ABU5CHF0_9BACI|nr:YciI family protein [Virgibacillus sp. 179-BFC.A HS]MDY0404963.1 YciI family protein [Virgibacillus sp. 179-BFC.A HS]
MKYFAVFLPMRDEAKSKDLRPNHLAYLKEQGEKGHIFVKGRFVDGWGGLVIYQGENLEEIEAIVSRDPYVVSGARDYEIHEWEMQKA